MVLTAGTEAPTFELLDGKGNLHKLTDFVGQTVVIYFYPKDDTPGCTKEACSFRDNYKAFKDAGIEIFGISPDNVKSHKKFSEKYNLPFILLSDPEHKVCEAYGVWGLKKSFGREYMGVFRTTYIIGPEGDIKFVFKNVKPANHSQEVIQAFEA
ncbi:MAG: thioredoxin-dependent thiol peroxidase [Chloroflexota bacterium]|nr:thioredoxin-dependent thiol peroxidase [Chloroflexota bacterium]